MRDSARTVGRHSRSEADDTVRHRTFRLLAVILVSVGVSVGVGAQPDPRQMSGLPLPDGELSDGTITVRVIRGQLSNNVPNHPVELHQGDAVATVNTDASGRASFITLSPGSEVYAVTELDGQRLESQRFPIPGRGGIRVMLVGAADPGAVIQPAERGEVTFGGQSSFQVVLGEETVEVYYVLDVLNMSSAPVEPVAPVVFDLPSGAQGTTVLSGSAPGTSADGPRVELPGPFQPGITPLRIAYILPYSSGSLALSQRLPAELESLVMQVEKVGAMDIASTQISRRREMGPEETGSSTYMDLRGPRIAAGEALAFELTGLPHRSGLPRTLALVLALSILGVGAWASFTPAQTEASTERRRSVETRKEKLFGDLVKVERQHRAGKIGSTKYSTRRSELFSALEHVYHELDEELAPVVLTSVRPAHKGSPVTGH